MITSIRTIDSIDNNGSITTIDSIHVDSNGYIRYIVSIHKIYM